jgi:rhodanese-related sulfurtransferase
MDFLLINLNLHTLRINPIYVWTGFSPDKTAPIFGLEDAAISWEVAMASNRISPDETNARVLAGEPVVFIDSRDPKAWGNSTRKIPGAIRIPAAEIERRLDEIDRTATVIAYCTSPNEVSSARVVKTLSDHGYRAFALRGGFDAWVAAEYPLEEKTRAA